MSFIIAVIVALTWGIGSSLFLSSRGYTNHGDYECMKAKERGDVTTAKLVSAQSFDARNTGDKRFSNVYYHNVYSYEVDGKEYRYQETSDLAQDSVEVCYDRKRNNKRIEPGKMNLWDHLRILSIPILFVFVLLALS